MAVPLLLLAAYLLRIAASGPAAQEPISPCPRYFTYISGGGDSAPMATVRVPVLLRELPVTLRITLTIRLALRTKYVGMLVLSDHPTLVLGNLLSGRSSTVNYTVRFPLPEPVPSLLRMELNNRTLCKGREIQPMYGGVLTTILLEHTFPAQPFNTRKKVGDEGGPRKPKDDVRCGIPRSLPSQDDEGTTAKENWPWLAAIFLKYERDVRFHCAGSLITKRHIVTAAHCIRNQINKNWNSSNFVVYLGMKNLDDYEQPNSQVREVTSIQIHPEYNEKNYVADIAILVIEAVSFNEHVSPVCLWNGGVTLTPLIGHLGTVVGWGLDRVTQRIQSVPEVFHLPIVDQAECLRSRKEFLYITSERTLCAGLRNGTGPCNGDSGSGLLILSYNNQNSLAWHLRGLISLSLLDRKMETCDLNEYIVFTDIARFNSWINRVISHF